MEVHELPDEIIYNILLRIPAEILVTFKAVCKPWCNFISDDHEFIYAHLNHHRGDFKQILVLNIKERAYELSHLQDKVQAATITNNFQLHHHQLQKFLKDDIEFCSSCEGLILYQSMHKQKHQLYLCNPVTYKCTILQSPLRETGGSSIGLWQWALTYDASLRKYKVFGLLATSHICYVLTPQSYHSNGGHVLGDTTDTSVVPTQWRELVICAPWPKSCSLSRLTLLSQELHLLVASRLNGHPEVTLCSLHVFKEEFREIELPFLTRLSCYWGKNSIIEVLGKLSITDYHREDDQLDIWSLQDREKGLWTKEYRVGCEFRITKVIPIRSHPSSTSSEQTEILTCHENQIFVCDLKLKHKVWKRMDFIHYKKTGGLFMLIFYTPIALSNGNEKSF